MFLFVCFDTNWCQVITSHEIGAKTSTGNLVSARLIPPVFSNSKYGLN